MPLPENTRRTIHTLSLIHISAALCIFVFHKAFTAQAWSALERETDLVRAGYEQTGDPTQLSAFVTDDLRVTLISQDGSVLFESATDQPMDCLLYTSRCV